jgi:hypothetical protein
MRAQNRAALMGNDGPDACIAERTAALEALQAYGEVPSWKVDALLMSRSKRRRKEQEEEEAREAVTPALERFVAAARAYLNSH